MNHSKHEFVSFAKTLLTLEVQTDLARSAKIDQSYLRIYWTDFHYFFTK